MRKIYSWRRRVAERLSRGDAQQDTLGELRRVWSRPQDPSTAFQELTRKFASFQRLLEHNNRALRLMSDLEEKAGGDYLFDINYLRSTIAALREDLKEIIDCMVAVGGVGYARLRGRFAAADRQVERALSGERPLEEDDLVIPFEKLRADRDWSVGAKAACLGEMKALGLPVPDGFAVSAWAYKRFLDANGLQERLADRLSSLDVRGLEALAEASREFQGLIASGAVPEDLAGELRRAAAELAARSPSGSFSLRSSALGEDGLLSFAGQYESFLNVRPDEVVDRYRDVLASQFTPRAIYYLLSHSLSEERSAMCAALVSMVDAAAAGVVYTRDPVSPDDGSMLINAVRGQGKCLVDGSLTPDVFRLSREGLSVLESRPARKPFLLKMSADGGLVREEIPDSEQEKLSIGEEALRELARMCLELEEHSGGPRDIEWALDREGRLFLLQNRPLRVFRRRKGAPQPDVSHLNALASGGVTICPGAGEGPISPVFSPRDLSKVPNGAVLAVSHPFPQLVTVMSRVRAIVSSTGGAASHLATLAREYRIPAVVLDPAGLEPGRPVTVDATGGAVYEGTQPDLIRARKEEFGSLEDERILALTARVLSLIAPLRLVHPADPDFTIASCRTFHDITRFSHQKSMEEMFSSGQGLQGSAGLGLRLKSCIPLPVTVLYVDPELAAERSEADFVEEEDTRCAPMDAFWAGVRQEGWPKPPPVNLMGFLSVVGTHVSGGAREGFAENSYALLGREYMLVSLRMGYHFTTVESMCTPEPSKNYVRMQYKHGGASPERRLRRIRLLVVLMGRMGFTNSSRGDFLDSQIAYQSREDTVRKLGLLGQLTIMTKQLDMALGSDGITDWYISEFAKKLGLEGGA
jgi:pyruvate,water dikinase